MVPGRLIGSPRTPLPLRFGVPAAALVTILAIGCAGRPVPEPEPSVTPAASESPARQATLDPTPDEEERCEDAGGDWSGITNECEARPTPRPTPTRTPTPTPLPLDPFTAVMLELNNPASQLGLTEADFIGRWNDCTQEDFATPTVMLTDLTGDELGFLYFTRQDILSASLQVYLHEDGGEVATVGMGAFPEHFLGPPANYLAEAAICAASPDLGGGEDVAILETLIAGHEADITGVDATVHRERRRYRLVDAGEEFGVWLAISGERAEDPQAAFATPAP